MPPKELPNGLNAREAELLVCYIKCIDTKPTVDYEKLATLGGYKGAKSARDNLGKLLKKILMDVVPMTEGNAGEARAEKAESSPRKRKGAAVEDGEAGDSPKKKKATPAKTRKFARAESEDDGEAVQEEPE